MRRTTLLAAALAAGLALAGCLQGAPVPGDGGDDGSAGDADARADGVHLVLERDRASITPREEHVYVNATATNEGDDTIHYREGCRHEWSVDVLDEDGDEVEWTRPLATCEGFSRAKLEPGESLTFPTADVDHPFRWNGTVWDGERYVDAEPGDYDVRITFHYQLEEEGAVHDLAAAVTVTVEG